MRAKSINEKFKETSDPIRDLGIGECERKLKKLKNDISLLFDKYYEMAQDNDNYWIAVDVIEEVMDLADWTE
jgi:hypothetical protein